MERRQTLWAATALLTVIGLLPLLMMVVNSFVVGGGFSLKAYQAPLGVAQRAADLDGQ